MAKDKKGASKGYPSAKDDARHLRKLERRLADARAAELTRSLKASEVQAEGASDKTVAKQQRKFEKAQRRVTRLQSEISALSPKVASKDAGQAQSPTVSEGLRAYCLREKVTVAMVDPTPIIMRNGRLATAGTCPGCGARLVRPGAARQDVTA